MMGQLGGEAPMILREQGGWAVVYEQNGTTRIYGSLLTTREDARERKRQLDGILRKNRVAFRVIRVRVKTEAA